MSDDFKRELISIRKYKAGYEIRYELWEHFSTTKPTPMKSAYTPKGEYIGSSATAHYLCVKRNITPTLKTSKSNVCSIGFCSPEQKWYGWSHRAIYGFGVGDVINNDDVVASVFPIGYKIKTIEDAKKVAIAFADGVS